MQSLNSCTVQRGIFSLRECGNASTDTCAQCMRPVCMEHAHYGAEQILCPQCYAASSKDKADEDSESEDTSDWDSPGWSGRWSTEYHSSHDYVPISAAGAHDSFDDVDRNAFATRSDGALDDEGDDRAGSSSGFSDS
ncbi:MAG TPA: hypothetical protein VLC92_15350 [Rhodocyclaceae bacterium]|nr:hypothetical protein [Rhodocyclaceae bacterium]